MSERSTTESLGVAEAKRRFGELIDRVGEGERIVISRRGKPALVLVAPTADATESSPRPRGLGAFAGALAEWDEFETVVAGAYRARGSSLDRPGPDLG